jgi:ABC-2 type transport system permease protein
MIWLEQLEGRNNQYQKYISFFRMRFIAGLQYRAAAVAGIATQFAWGILGILTFKAFYEVDAAAFPMTFAALSSYIWLQQAFLAIFMTWLMENDIFQTITDGGIAYELCRPIELYDMWFVRSMASRLSKAVLRCMPILFFAAFLPYPYGIGFPINLQAGIWFSITMVLGFLVVVAFCMLVYITTFFTFSPTGVRLVAVSLVEFFAGAVIPLPFLPEKIRRLVELLPFASMQNVPLRIYSGDIAGTEIYEKVGLQLFWIFVLIWIGKKIISIALKRVVVQGG